jgi:hypothetical protein
MEFYAAARNLHSCLLGRAMVHAATVSRCDWTAFLESFSRQHEGWLISLDVGPATNGSAREARELPLDGITFEATTDALIVALREPGGSLLTHVVRSPRRLTRHETPQGTLGLEIVAADGGSTMLRFRTIVAPELVDGVAGPWPPRRPPG